MKLEDYRRSNVTLLKRTCGSARKSIGWTLVGGKRSFFCSSSLSTQVIFPLLTWQALVIGT